VLGDGLYFEDNCLSQFDRIHVTPLIMPKLF
jgi:hypothetical protein